jgi:hypothetical protein
VVGTHKLQHTINRKDTMPHHNNKANQSQEGRNTDGKHLQSYMTTAATVSEPRHKQQEELVSKAKAARNKKETTSAINKHIVQQMA